MLSTVWQRTAGCSVRPVIHVDRPFPRLTTAGRASDAPKEQAGCSFERSVSNEWSTPRQAACRWAPRGACKARSRCVRKLAGEVVVGWISPNSDLESSMVGGFGRQPASRGGICVGSPGNRMLCRRQGYGTERRAPGCSLLRYGGCGGRPR